MQCIMRGLSRRLPFELVGHLTAVKVMVLGAAQANVTSLKDVDLESRSSSSDVDSNRRYFLDDSASSSDGSDSGHYEPFSAARAMALNRMQQQQRPRAAC
jgi:hypothetical protein